MVSEDEEENGGERQNCKRVFSWEDRSGYSILARWAVPPPVALKAFLFQVPKITSLSGDFSSLELLTYPGAYAYG
jgi:hypothetical protein